MRHQLSAGTVTAFASLALLAGLALLADAPAMLHAQADAFRGTYVLDPAASDDVNAAIGRAMRGGDAAARPADPEGLRRASEPYPRILFASDRGVTIEFARRTSAVFPLDGTPVRWRSGDGEEFEVSTRAVRGRLEQRFVSDGSRRTNTYVLSDDGRTLTLDVVIETPQLAWPLRHCGPGLIVRSVLA